MTDDLRTWFQRTADDADRPLPVRPVELLVRARRQRRRREALTVGGTVAAAAVTIGALAFGGTILRAGPAGDDATPPDTGERRATTETVPLDRGPLSAEQRNATARLGVFSGPLDPDNPLSLEGYTFPFARRMIGPEGTLPMVIAIPPSGAGISIMTTTGGALRPIPEAPDASRPIHDADEQSGESNVIYPTAPGYWIASGIYRVHDSIDRVEVRVGTPDGSEPWRVAEPHGGYVVWATWFERSAYDPGDRLVLQWRAYDTEGDPVAADLLPDQPLEVVVSEPEQPDRGGPAEDARDDERLRELFFEVAKDHLDPAGEHIALSDAPKRYSAWWIFEWSIAGDPGLGGVTIDVRAPGEFTPGKDGDLAATLGCHTDLEPCERRDLGGAGWAWVGEAADGSIGVALVRADGAAVLVNVDQAFDQESSPLTNDMGLTIEDAIAVATDQRLNDVIE